MPRIPGIEYSTRLAAGTNTASASAASEGAGIGQGMSELGRALGNVGGIIKDAYDESTASDAVTKATDQLNQFVVHLKNGGVDDQGKPVAPPTPDKHQELFNQEVQRIQEGFGKDLSFRASKIFSQHFDSYSKVQGLEVQKNSIELMHGNIRGMTREANDSDALQFVDADNNILKEAVRNRVYDRIDSKVRYGIYTPDQGAAEKRRWDDDAERGSFLKVMQKNPLDAIRALDRGEYNKLDADKRQAMRNAAFTEIEQRQKSERAEAERQDRAEAKVLKKKQDETFKTALEKGPLLDPKWVIANRDNFSPEHYKWALSRARGESEEPNDPTMLDNLLTRAYRGEDVSEEASNAFTKTHHLNESGYRLVMENTHQNSVTAKKQNFGKAGMEYIDQALRPNIYTQTPADMDRLVATKAEWSHWVEAHSNASAQEAEKEYTRLATSAKIVDFSGKKIALPKPMYLDSRRNASRKTLADAMKALEEARSKNEIDDYAFKREIRIIKQWSDALPPETNAEVGVK